MRRSRTSASRPKRKQVSSTPPLRLAPLDSLAREIQHVLELVKPLQSSDDGDPMYSGYCGVATEAYLHLAGAKRPDLKVMRTGHDDGTSHWWLIGPSGVIDLMYGPSDRRKLHRGLLDPYPYEEGRGAMFQNGYKRPSKRAAAIIELVRSRRQTT